MHTLELQHSWNLGPGVLDVVCQTGKPHPTGRRGPIGSSRGGLHSMSDMGLLDTGNVASAVPDKRLTMCVFVMSERVVT